MAGVGPGFSRRGFLIATGVAAGGALGLSGCDSDDSSSEDAAAAAGGIKILDSGAKLPTENVTFRLVDNGDVKGEFWKTFFPLYEKAHPNIKTQYDALAADKAAELMALGLRNGSAHDLFFTMPAGANGAKAVAEGWVAPLEDRIPNFQEWKSKFPPSTFFEGVNLFEGKTYTFPIISAKRYNNMLLFNEQLMQDAGYDPASKQLTWDEFRDAAKKITDNGKGKAYGVIFAGKQPPNLAWNVRTLATIAGSATMGQWDPPAGGDIDPKTGEYAYLSDGYLGALELLLALVKDGSVFPGSASTDAPGKRARFGQGQVGMVLDGPWAIVQWEKDVPDLKFGAGLAPQSGNGEPLPVNVLPSAMGYNLWSYAESKVPTVGADILWYLGTLEGQKAWASIAGVSDPPIFPEASTWAKENLELSPAARKSLDLNETIVLAPDPAVRNPDGISKVNQELKALTPNFPQTVQALFVGKETDVRKAMQDLKDRAEKELDRAIKAAQGKGATVSRDDFVFPNWDGRSDYTEEHYKSL